VAAEHRELVRWLDRAAAKGALHRNTAARRKAQAARLISDRG
jgi:small subunit ribosomal protein S20